MAKIGRFTANNPHHAESPSSAGIYRMLEIIYYPSTGNEAEVELHVSSQADSKALVGSYICSDVPGEFVWQAGILTQAVVHGHWLVIEDVDKAPLLDFISSISTLLEHRQLTLPPSNQFIDAHPSFRTLYPVRASIHA
eukprot:gene31904-41394_t